MASWSNPIDREKWRLALLGGIEVRRASGNAEAGNGGSGAGGLSKPTYFQFTSMPYAYEVLEGLGVSFDHAKLSPATFLVDPLTVGAAFAEFRGTETRYVDYAVTEGMQTGAKFMSFKGTGGSTGFVKLSVQDNTQCNAKFISGTMTRVVIRMTAPVESTQVGASFISFKGTP